MQSAVLAAVLAACLVAAHAADDAAVIVDSGSTNTAGYRIIVERSGKAAYTQMPRRYGRPSDEQPTSKTRDVASELVKRFYADLDAARPFSELPRQGCMKSASFGTTLTIEFAGERSPDLSCGDRGNAKVKALIEDVSEICKLFSDK